MFKENSKCVICGKFLRRPGEICDECVAEIYLESLLTGETVLDIFRRYKYKSEDAIYTILKYRMKKLRSNQAYFEELLFRILARRRSSSINSSAES